MDSAVDNLITLHNYPNVFNGKCANFQWNLFDYLTYEKVCTVVSELFYIISNHMFRAEYERMTPVSEFNVLDECVTKT